jgi:hypothetical protein
MMAQSLLGRQAQDMARLNMADMQAFSTLPKNQNDKSVRMKKFMRLYQDQ